MEDERQQAESLRKAAGAIGSTEVAGFSLQGVDKHLTPVCHIRGGTDDAPPDVKASAMKAFTEIVESCLAQGKDGYFRVGRPDRLKGPQFCLVALARRGEEVVGAAAFIVRCADEDAAKLVLRLARWEAAPFLKRP